jgi:putative isomerase
MKSEWFEPLTDYSMTTQLSAIAYADQFSSQRARGWNTWDTRSVFRHVLMPEGLAISLGFAAMDKLVWLDQAFFGRQELPRTAGTQLTSTDKRLPTGNLIEIKPGLHAYDGSYTELEVDLRGARYRVQTASDGDEWIALIEPEQAEAWPRVLTVQASLLWGNPGFAERKNAWCMQAHLPQRELGIHATGEEIEDPNLPAVSPYLAFRLSGAVALSTGTPISLLAARAKVQAARQQLAHSHAAYGSLGEAHEAMQSCLAWNLIYEPRFRRVICPVARDWNCKRGGYAIFCWDSFLTAWMIGQDDPELGYACALETFREMVDGAFVANVVQGTGRRALDRSQPPVGSLALLGMYRQHPNLDALRAAWPALLAWNRWWHAARRNQAGSLSLGSHPFAPQIGDPAEFVQPNTRAGAALESGLDNLPIYDSVAFDEKTHLMQTEDVGLNSLYVADCESLAEIAAILDCKTERTELQLRTEAYREALRRLWWPEGETYRDRAIGLGGWIGRGAATCFYPLLAGAPTPTQARLMLEKHLLNPAEYGGERMLAAIPRSDQAFMEQLYMRGRIWPPITFLVYLGLQRYGLDAARKKLVSAAHQLLLCNWRQYRTVPENLSAIDGVGGIGAHSHPLYGWGGLFAMMSLIEQGVAAMPLPKVEIREMNPSA